MDAETLILLVNDWTTAAGRGHDDHIFAITTGAAAPTNSTAATLGGLLLVRGGAGMDPPPRRGRGRKCRCQLLLGHGLPLLTMAVKDVQIMPARFSAPLNPKRGAVQGM